MTSLLQVVERAKREDLKKKIRYEVSYIKNKKGKIIIDRRFNTASLMNVYLGQGVVDAQGVSWNPDDPNRLSFQLPGKLCMTPNIGSCKRVAQKVTFKGLCRMMGFYFGIKEVMHQNTIISFHQYGIKAEF